jgi:hypothetical protein
MLKAERRNRRNATGVNARIGARVQAVLGYLKERYLPISKWTSVTAMALAVVVMAMSLSVGLMASAVRFSLIPVLLAAAAWSLANMARDRRLKLFAILALWVGLGGVFMSQVQYYRLVQGAQVENTPVQQQQQN